MRSELVGELLQVDALEVLKILRSAREKIRGGYTQWSSRTEGPADARVAELDRHMLGYSVEYSNGRALLRAHPAGAWCPATDEGVRFYDLWGALELAAGGNLDARIVAEDLLISLISPEHFDRAHASACELLPLLAAFDRAVLRAQAVSRRKD